jgi:hypothetical protein
VNSSKYIGETFKSKYGVEYTVLRKVGHGYEILVLNNNTTYTVDRDVVKTNSLLKIAMEIGLLDKHPHIKGKYAKRKSVAGNKWKDMKDRCYTKTKTKMEKDSSYIGCEVCEEWLDFDNFADWFYLQVGHDLGWELDKDLIKDGNTVYCPEYCVLIPKEINLFMKTRKNRPNGLPTGVSYARDHYRVECKFREWCFTSRFKTVEDASNFYKEKKYFLACKLKEVYTGIVPEDILNILVNKYYKQLNPPL